MFQPVVIGSGLGSWQFLQTTYDRQLNTFSQAPQIQRDTDYFVEKIGSITKADDLVADRRLMTVALGAFGLQDDINNKYFIQKMLDEGTTANDSLANRFADTRYRDFSAAFGFGPNEIPRTLLSAFPEEIVSKFKANSFELATGVQNDGMRTALYARRVLPDLVSDDGSDRSKWFSIMGQPPLRKVFETALGLPSSFAQVDIDKQLEVFRDRATSVLDVNDPAELSDPGKLAQLIDLYVVRDQINTFNSVASPASIALSILRS